MNGPAGRLIAVDLSNLCRDRRLHTGSSASGDDAIVEADLDRLDRFLTGVRAAGIEFDQIRLVADRNLPALIDRAGRRRLRELEHDGTLEFSSIADERLLELTFANDGNGEVLVASMDFFDDFRRTFPQIQGCTDRFLGWAPESGGGVRVFLRDMGVHTHRRISRKEEAAEFKARRLRRQSVVQRATGHDFRCATAGCLLAQLWPDRIPELPRYDDHDDRFVCPSCAQPLIFGDERPASTEIIIQLDGVEQFRLLLEAGDRRVLGRTESQGRIGLTHRLPQHPLEAVSREHLAFEYDGTAVRVEDLGSRNGTLLRDPSGRERRLTPGQHQVLGPRATLVLPSGITCELSGRSTPRPGHDLETGDPESAGTDGRMTRLLVTRR